MQKNEEMERLETQAGLQKRRGLFEVWPTRVPKNLLPLRDAILKKASYCNFCFEVKINLALPFKCFIMLVGILSLTLQLIKKSLSSGTCNIFIIIVNLTDY